MRDETTITVLPDVIAIPPRQFGVNLETQTDHEVVNLWDWLADSGATVVREFHPEVSLRRPDLPLETWPALADASQFESWRAQRREDPVGRLTDHYRFDCTIPWLGCPDGIVEKVRECGCIPLLSLAYAPREFPRPLVMDLDHIGPVADDGIDWQAAASAYDYYFTQIYHYARHHQCRQFMMINEPENRWGWFHLPADLEQELDGAAWMKTSWNEDHPEVAERYFGLIATQVAVLSRLARMALHDVAGILQIDERAFSLSGPTNIVWEPFWELARDWLDICDVHHYHRQPATFARRFALVKAACGETHGFACSEFNLQSGGMPIERALWGLEESLAAAEQMLYVFSLGDPGGPPFSFATFYLFHFPSTHRNYKHLLYGDMNLVDWSGADTPVWSRGDAWWPTAREMQIRHATPAYHCFRMLSRALGMEAEPAVQLQTAAHNPTSAGPEDLHAGLQSFAFLREEQLFVYILNRTRRPAERVRVQTHMCGKTFRFCVVRETSRRHADALQAAIPATAFPPVIRVPEHSFLLLQFTPLALDEMDSLRLEEDTFTPGTVHGLAYLQTTRLRAIGRLAGQEYDLSELAVTWQSSCPECVRVYQGGLVQVVRPVHERVVVSASTPFGVEACIEINVLPGDAGNA